MLYKKAARKEHTFDMEGRLLSTANSRARFFEHVVSQLAGKKDAFDLIERLDRRISPLVLEEDFAEDFCRISLKRPRFRRCGERDSTLTKNTIAN